MSVGAAGALFVVGGGAGEVGLLVGRKKYECLRAILAVGELDVERLKACRYSSDGCYGKAGAFYVSSSRWVVTRRFVDPSARSNGGSIPLNVRGK